MLEFYPPAYCDCAIGMVTRWQGTMIGIVELAGADGSCGSWRSNRLCDLLVGTGFTIDFEDFVPDFELELRSLGLNVEGEVFSFPIEDPIS